MALAASWFLLAHTRKREKARVGLGLLATRYWAGVAKGKGQSSLAYQVLDAKHRERRAVLCGCWWERGGGGKARASPCAVASGAACLWCSCGAWPRGEQGVRARGVSSQSKAELLD